MAPIEKIQPKFNSLTNLVITIKNDYIGGGMFQSEQCVEQKKKRSKRKYIITDIFIIEKIKYSD